MAVVAAPRASRRRADRGGSDTPETLLASPAFAAAVKRGMAAAGFPVDVAVVGVSASGAVAPARAPALAAAGPTVAPTLQPAPVTAAASAAPTSKAGAIAGAVAGVAAVGGVLAVAAALAARGGRRAPWRTRLPSSADGGGATADTKENADTTPSTDIFHGATGDTASECGTDSGVAALAATPGVARVMAALRAAAADRAAAVAGVAPPPAGDLVAGRYVVGERLGRRVCAARDTQAGGGDAPTPHADPASVVLKLYAPGDAAAANAHVSLVSHGGPGGAPLEGVLPISADLSLSSPPLRVLVSPRGQFSLADWLAGTRGRRPRPGSERGGAAAARYTVAAVARRVSALHTARVTHRVLDPRRFVWRGGDWWLTVTAAASVATARAPVVVGALRYAAPETLATVAAGRRAAPAATAADAWSLGVILYEVFAGRPLFPAAARDAAVAGALLGLAPLPTEAPSGNAWRAVRDPAARVLLQGLLVREPGATLSVEDALQSPALGCV